MEYDEGLSKYDLLMWARVDKSKLFIYSVCEDGTAHKMSNKLNRESRVKPYLDSSGKATVKINNKEYTLKNLIAKHFHPDYFPGAFVELIDDSDPFNCAVGNLRIYTKREHGIRTAPRKKAHPVIVNGKRYPSVRAAAKAHYMSYQTMLDYLSGNYKKYSVCHGMEIVRV